MSKSVTWTPKAVKIEANSQPITPGADHCERAERLVHVNHVVTRHNQLAVHLHAREHPRPRAGGNQEAGRPNPLAIDLERVRVNETSRPVDDPHLQLLEVAQVNLGQCRRSGAELIVDFVEPHVRPGRVIAAPHLERNEPVFGQLIHPLRLVSAVKTVAEQVPHR